MLCYVTLHLLDKKCQLPALRFSMCDAEGGRGAKPNRYPSFLNFILVSRFRVPESLGTLHLLTIS